MWNTSIVIVLAFLCFYGQVICFSEPKQVLVTGAVGRTGKLVFKNLLLNQEYQPIGLVRSSKSVNELKKLGASDEQIIVGDVLQPTALASAMTGKDYLVICTSAVPKIKLFSLAKTLFSKAIGRQGGRPEFYWAKNGSPEEVDWTGQKNQIDAAKAAGVKHVVLLGSMGGTQPENFLNTIGKKPDGTGGDILLWKRKAEKYLIASGLTFTIVHAGGLLVQPGGQREILLSVDDKLLSGTHRSIPREDVAEVCVQALGISSARNRAIDIASKPPGEGKVTTNFVEFFAQRGTCRY